MSAFQADSSDSVVVMGVDTSLRSTGVGLIRVIGRRMDPVAYEVIKNSVRHSHSVCLLHLFERLTDVIAEFKPATVAIEGVFFCKNIRTTLVLGEARGVVIAACSSAGLTIHEYAPRRVKQSVVGFGAAEKNQVRRMVMSLLQLTAEPHEDASDALAIALCHANAFSRVGGQLGDSI